MSTTNATSPTLSTGHPSWVRFYPAMATLVLVFCTMAFGPSLVDRTHRSGALDLLDGLHGLVFCAWLVLFLVQSILAAHRNLGLHRILGTGSILLAAAMIVLGYETSIAMARRGYDLSGDLAIRQDPLAGLYFPLLDTFMFAVLFAAAWVYRRRPAIHKRLMLLTITAALIPAPVAHFVGHFVFFRNKVFPTVLLIALFLAAGAIHDQITKKHIHPVSLWIPVVIFVVENASASFVIPSKEWHIFAARLIRIETPMSKESRERFDQRVAKRIRANRTFCVLREEFLHTIGTPGRKSLKSRILLGDLEGIDREAAEH